MTYQRSGQDRLEYYPCRYQGSRVLFRGPRRDLSGSYIAYLGGLETYGRFVETPYPTLLERRLAVACANFGVVNAGVDLYLQDPAILDLAAEASAKVLQVMGAQNMSNRFYQVHPRRNDRFLRASERLETLYPEVDFTDFHFNRHMLGHLAGLAPDRFDAVVEELQQAWIARMKHLLTILRGNVVLLWFSRHDPSARLAAEIEDEPLFVTRKMLQTLEPRVAAVVEVVPPQEVLMEGTVGMHFTDYEACAAEEQMGPRAHELVANALEVPLRSLVRAPK